MNIKVLVFAFCIGSGFFVPRLVFVAQAFGQSDSVGIRNLTVDLLSGTDYQSAGGYRNQPQWNLQAFQEGQAVRVRNAKPALGWQIDSDRQGFRQKAYQVLVSDNLDSLKKDIGTWWNSEKVTSAGSSAISYDGKSLESHQLYFWKVRVWDEQGRPSSYSPVSCFYTDSLTNGYQTVRYPLTRTDTFPEQVSKVSESTYFADFGKAAFGQLRLHLKSDREDTVLVHLGERVTQTGRLDREPGGSIRYQVYELPLRQGSHSYQIRIRKDQRNTGSAAVLMPDYIGEVLPFRYVEIEGYEPQLSATDLQRSAVHYPFDDEASYFNSSNDTLNQLWDFCKYSVKATTFAGVYVDGDRERIPYEADAYINQLCHYSVDQEYSLARYSHEYLIGKPTWPTEWILQSVLMAWNDYLYTGDLRSANAFYEDLKAKTLVPLEESNGLISTKKGKLSPELLQAIHFEGKEIRDIVDWPHGGILGLGAEDRGETDGFVFSDFNAVVNAYYYKALLDFAALASALGKAEDASAFGDRAKRVHKAYQQLFFDKKQGVYRDGDSSSHASLHSNMFALTFGLVPDELRQQVMDFIRSRGLACSVYGSQFLMDALYEGGEADYALQLLTSTKERSWYNMIREGSTVSMEAWGNKFKPNQDWNHVWGAVPANTIIRKLMGVEPLESGWTRFSVRPQLSTLAHAKAKVPTIKGPVEIECRQKPGSFEMNLSVPANSNALVQIPVPESAGRVNFIMDGKRLKVSSDKGWLKVPEIPAGKHELSVSW